MDPLFDSDAACRWLVDAFTEYHDARTLDGASHEQALETVVDFGYSPETWPGHRLPSKRQVEIRRAAGRELRREHGHLDADNGRSIGTLLRCLAGLQRADAAAATLFPDRED